MGRAPTSGVVAALAALAVTAGAAALGGTASGRTTLPAGTGTVATLGARTFACTGGLPGGRMQTGTLGGRVEDRPLTRLERVQVPRREARGAFAAQLARPGGRFALGLCPEPRNDWWFTGAGGSVTHGSTLTVVNPRPGAAVVNIEVFGASGVVEAPGLQGVTIPGRSSRAYRLPEVAPATGDLVVHVRAVRGLVSVGATDSFAISGGIGSHAREFLPDTDRPARRVLLTGLQRRPARADLLVANPGDAETIVEVELVGEQGPFRPQGLERISVPPHTVVRRDVRKAFDGTAVAVRLTAGAPILGTVRSLRGGDESLATAAAPLHGDSVVALPAAATRDVVLTGLAKGTVRVVAYSAAGRQLDEQRVDVKADVSTLVEVPRKAAYALFSTTRPIAIAGVLVAVDSGVASMAVPPAARALRVPAVRPGW